MLARSRSADSPPNRPDRCVGVGSAACAAAASSFLLSAISIMRVATSMGNGAWLDFVLRVN